MSPIKIDQEGFCTYIEVGGVRLQGVMEANVRLDPEHLPTVEVRLAMGPGSGMQFADGCLKVGALHAPQELERALLAHLKAKYDVRLPVVGMGVDQASGPDQSAMAVCLPTCELTIVNRPADAADRAHVETTAAKAVAAALEHPSRILSPLGLRKGETAKPGADPMEAVRAMSKAQR